MTAVEDVVEACCPGSKSNSKLELLELATTVVQHGVGFCEDMCIHENADVSFGWRSVRTVSAPH